MIYGTYLDGVFHKFYIFDEILLDKFGYMIIYL